jgi:hypothetical protein
LGGYCRKQYAALPIRLSAHLDNVTIGMAAEKTVSVTSEK